MILFLVARFQTRLIGNERQTYGTFNFVYGLTYGFQGPIMIRHMVSKNPLCSYTWFSRTNNGRVYGLEEPFMASKMVVKSKLSQTRKNETHIQYKPHF